MTLVELTLSRVGLTAPSDGYAAAICLSPRDNRHDMMLMSGCALVVRGLWHELGVLHPLLVQPYVIGRAVVDVIQIAKEANCLDPAGYEIQPGSVVVINNPIHVFTVVSIDGPLVESIDGGQRVATGQETIARRSRYHTKGEALDGRPILHVIDGAGVVDYWAARSAK